jgi:hypothetical protein
LKAIAAIAGYHVYMKDVNIIGLQDFIVTIAVTNQIYGTLTGKNYVQIVF